MPAGKFLAASLRENSGIYVLASLSNAFLIMSQYLAVSAAVASYLPVDSATAVLIASYGRGVGIGLALFLNSLVFQGILAVLVAMLALASIVKTGWKWAYAFSGVAVSSFVGYWLGAKFLAILEWISTLQDNRVDSTNPYAGLFWFGLAATISYLAMILVLRKSYGKLAERYYAVKGPIGSDSFHTTERSRLSPSISGSRVQPRIRTQNRSEQTPINDLGGEFHMMPSSRLHDPVNALVENGLIRLF